MPATTEVMEIVAILNEEGFGVLAGEMLIELNLGREISVPDGTEEELADKENVTSDASPIDSDYIDLDDGSRVLRAYFDERGGRAPPEAGREPIPDKEQLRFVAEFLRLRLVEPVRVWAEAERIAGDLLSEPKDGGGKTKHSAKAVRIAFEPSFEDAAPRMVRDAAPGTAFGTDELLKVLNVIAELDA